MTWQRHETTRIALVMVLALVARFAFLGVWQSTHVPGPHQFEFPDSAGYWELGQRLAAGETYQVGSPDRRVHRAPGYPLLLAAMFRVVGQDASPTWARAIGGRAGSDYGRSRLLVSPSDIWHSCCGTRGLARGPLSGGHRHQCIAALRWTVLPVDGAATGGVEMGDRRAWQRKRSNGPGNGRCWAALPR